MKSTPEIRAALASEVLRAFVRGWCRNDVTRQRVVCAYLVCAYEGRDSTVRSIADMTGVGFMVVHRTLSSFRRAVKSAQEQEERLGVSIRAWAPKVDPR